MTLETSTNLKDLKLELRLLIDRILGLVNRIHVSGEGCSLKIVSNTLTRLLQRLRALKIIRSKDEVILSVLVVDSVEMAFLNNKYRKKNGPTDVLSFENQDRSPVKGYLFMGDLVICPEVIRIQAKAQKNRFSRELEVIIVHGLLHLMGFDHEKSTAKAKKMADLEKKLLRSSGLISRGLVKGR